ncbi:MAG: transglycosylase domain-containing protein [Lachnospiraceae bacterium]|nr:transglycosylase domain-containing protein [Lachnospiraceae bacterium]
MDYSKRGVAQKQAALKSGTAKVAMKGAITIFRVVIVAILAICIIGGYAAYGMMNGLVSNSPSLANLDLRPTGYKTTIYYADGTICDTLYGAESNRSYAYIDEIPLVVRQAFIAKEDTRFYEHNGIDVQGIFRAIVSDIRTRSFDYGGSTITQQLLKNKLFGGGDEDDNVAKITRKVQEQYLAIQAENMYEKDEILEFYLNLINLGNGNFGIKEAAYGYFGKDVSELTLSEACVLAPIAYSPTRRNPVRYPEKNAIYREETLKAMLEQGYCTKEEYEEALADPVYERIMEVQQTVSAVKSAPTSYFTDELIEQLLSDLQTRLGYTEAEASTLIYSGGLTIHTTQDPRIQKIMDEYYSDDSNFPKFGEGSYYELNYAISVYKPDGSVIHYHMSDLLKYFANYQDTKHLYYHEKGGWVGVTELCLNADELNERCDEYKATVVEEGDTAVERRVITPQPQSSMVIIDQHNGHVVAIYGGRGPKTASRVLNRATNTVRQVGSTFKVLASFLPALDGGGQTLASVVDDSQFVYPGTYKEVTNWYTTGYRGITSMRKACADSMNVCAVEFLERIGARLSFNYLKKLGFTTLVESRKENGVIYSDIALPLALGGLTDGVTNLELTAAYATIANNGIYQTPIFYTEVYDHEGKLLLKNESVSTQVIKTSTAWLLTSAMIDVVEAGTGGRLRIPNMTVAGKTGTSKKANDLWFVGFTPYYTAGIWTGYDNNFSQKNTKYQQDLWQHIMAKIHTELELKNQTYEVPDSIVTAKICTKCGKLAVEGLCDEYVGGNCIAEEYFAKGTVPTEKCTCHKRVRICTESGHLASPECPTSSIVEMVLLAKEERIYIPIDDLERLAKEKGVAYVGTTLPDDRNPNVTYDENGNRIETIIRMTTWDTPFLVPYDEKADPCPVHNPWYYQNGGGTSFELPDEDDIKQDDNKDDTIAH